MTNRLEIEGAVKAEARTELVEAVTAAQAAGLAPVQVLATIVQATSWNGLIETLCLTRGDRPQAAAPAVSPVAGPRPDTYGWGAAFAKARAGS